MTASPETPNVPEPARIANVELHDRATRTYVGWTDAGFDRTMYEQARGRTWHRSSGQGPSEPELNELLEFVLMHAIARGAPALRGTWSNGDPTILSDSE
jgi:hypothetical protein